MDNMHYKSLDKIVGGERVRRSSPGFRRALKTRGHNFSFRFARTGVGNANFRQIARNLEYTWIICITRASTRLWGVKGFGEAARGSDVRSTQGYTKQQTGGQVEGVCGYADEFEGTDA